MCMSITVELLCEFIFTENNATFRRPDKETECL